MKFKIGELQTNPKSKFLAMAIVNSSRFSVILNTGKKIYFGKKYYGGGYGFYNSLSQTELFECQNVQEILNLV